MPAAVRGEPAATDTATATASATATAATAGRAPAPRTARPRNRRGEGSQLRADILAAATDLLDRGGARAVTLRAVARRAGITAPSIYPHFPDLPALMRALVHEAFGELTGRLRAAVAPVADDEPEEDPEEDPDDDPGNDPDVALDAAEGAEDRLYAACLAYLDYAAARPERYRAMYGEPPGHPGCGGSGADRRAPRGAEALNILAGALADCVNAGRSASTDPAADASALWLGLHGLAHQRANSRISPLPATRVRPFVAALSHLDRPRQAEHLTLRP